MEVLPIAMSVDGGLLHRHLRGYKDDRSPEVRVRMSLRLAALVAVFLDHDGGCVGAFDSVVLVPSSTRTAAESIVQRVRVLRDEYRPALAVTGVGPREEVRTDRFALTRDVAGERVLLLDDTFTTGASLFSAVGSLSEAGAVVVGPVVLGRHLQPGWGPTADLLAWLKGRKWDERRCSRCEGERAVAGRLL